MTSGWPSGKFGAILADPPWSFKTWSENGEGKSAQNHYACLDTPDLGQLPVAALAAPDCVLFLWATWPMLKSAIWLISKWGFTYKTCAFDWMKANASQIDMFRDDTDASMGMGFWTRSNSEPCLLATRGKPKRLNADVRQGIIAPRRQHSRKPDCIYERIERLVAGPRLELFARTRRPGWTSWGLEVDKFSGPKDVAIQNPQDQDQGGNGLYPVNQR